MTLISSNQQIESAIRQIIVEMPFYGGVLIRLKREYRPTLPVAVDITWEAPYWGILINPSKLVDFSKKDVMMILCHQVLHLLWEHPVRYAKLIHNPHQKLVSLATDLAINQVLPAGYPGAIMVRDIETSYQIKLPHYADSSEYYRLLQTKVKSITGEGENEGDQDIASQHLGWQHGRGDEAQMALVGLFKAATKEEASKQVGRGQLSVQVTKQLNQMTQATHDWKSVVSHYVQQATEAVEPTRARFNRRQPWRLDLMGQHNRQTIKLHVFIDQSASIADQQVVQFLDEVAAISQQIQISLETYAFDTQVYPVDYREKWQRQARGGTTFQAIFDYIADNHFIKMSDVILILTDGAGEKEVQLRRRVQVLWALTSDGQMSLVNPVGRIMTL